MSLAAFGTLTAGRAERRLLRLTLSPSGPSHFSSFSHIGDWSLGIDQAGASRYTYILIGLLIPLAGIALSHISARRRRLQVLIWIALIGLAVYYNMQLLPRDRRSRGHGKAGLRKTILAAAYVASDPQQAVFQGAVAEPALWER